MHGLVRSLRVINAGPLEGPYGLIGTGKLQDMATEIQAGPSAPHWQEYQTILLDMDGTVLDLAFDNYFWRELVPEVYAEKRDISEDDAREHIHNLYASREGTLEWYCLEHWNDRLGQGA